MHDLATLHPPFTVKAVDRNHAFIPLAMDDEMTIDEILTSHPKGVDYAHLLEGMNHVPIIEDSREQFSPFHPSSMVRIQLFNLNTRPVHRCDRMGQESM